MKIIILPFLLVIAARPIFAYSKTAIFQTSTESGVNATVYFTVEHLLKDRPHDYGAIYDSGIVVTRTNITTLLDRIKEKEYKISICPGSNNVNESEVNTAYTAFSSRDDREMLITMAAGSESGKEILVSKNFPFEDILASRLQTQNLVFNFGTCSLPMLVPCHLVSSTKAGEYKVEIHFDEPGSSISIISRISWENFKENEEYQSIWKNKNVSFSPYNSSNQMPKNGNLPVLRFQDVSSDGFVIM